MVEFLQLNTSQEFWKIVEEYARPGQVGREKVEFTTALGRILASDIYSPLSLPPFSRSTVDGFAVRAQDTRGISDTLPGYLQITGEVFMGKEAGMKVESGQAVRIPTGGMLPEGADAVVMVEYTELLDDMMVEVHSSIAPGENVVECGEDIKEGDLLFQQGHKLRPQDLGALAGLGITQVEVYKRPQVSVISTGDELVEPGQEPVAGEIRDINSYSIGSLLDEAGGQTKLTGIVRDTAANLQKTVVSNLASDLVLISGGSSVGVKDITIDVLNSLGKPGVLLHGVAVKPGKPTILAFIDGTPVIGLPGHPASAWTITSIFVKPFLQMLQGELSLEMVRENLEDRQNNRGGFIQARLDRNLNSEKGRDEYVPVSLYQSSSEGERVFKARPILGKSSLFTTLVEADGYIVIKQGQEGLYQGANVAVFKY